jgi:dienelactone hydrolase
MNKQNSSGVDDIGSVRQRKRCEIRTLTNMISSLQTIFTSRLSKYSCLFVLAACLQTAGAEEITRFPSPGEGKLIHFDSALPRVANAARGVDYNFDLAQESFEIVVPRNYSDKEAFGVFAFMDSGDSMTMPGEWAAIMEKEKLICLIPQKIGNNQPFSRRVGLTLIGILKTVERYKVDPRRIYTGGLSGGARCSLQLAFLHNDVIAGNISICGANFYQPVPKVHDTEKSDYGVWPVPPDRIAAAKGKVRFVFITGAKDFRYGKILDIYEGGFVKNGFQARLIDQPNMGHQMCSSSSLLEAFHFVSGGR